MRSARRIGPMPWLSQTVTVYERRPALQITHEIDNVNAVDQAIPVDIGLRVKSIDLERWRRAAFQITHKIDHVDTVCLPIMIDITD